MIEYTGKGKSPLTVDGETVTTIAGPRSLVRALLESGEWQELVPGVAVKSKKPARKKRGK